MALRPQPAQQRTQHDTKLAGQGQRAGDLGVDRFSEHPARMAYAQENYKGLLHA